MRSCQGQTNLKSWLMCAPNTFLPTEPLGALAGSSECRTLTFQHPAQAPLCLAKSKVKGQKALHRAQLGLQLLGEASSVLQKVLTHVLLFLEGKKKGSFLA